MKNPKNLDQALERFRKATISSAPSGMTRDIVSQLPSFVLPISLPRFFALISLGAGVAAVACTLLMVSQEEVSPPLLPEFSGIETDKMFSQP